MLIVDYQSKSYHRFLSDMQQIENYKTRFLITFNGANENELIAAAADLTENTNNQIKHSAAINNKASESEVAELFTEVRNSRDILLFENADLLFGKKTELKTSHERDNGFDINNLFKSIAKHNGIVILANATKQTLSATMSSKMDVLIRF